MGNIESIFMAVLFALLLLLNASTFLDIIGEELFSHRVRYYLLAVAMHFVVVSWSYLALENERFVTNLRDFALVTLVFGVIMIWFYSAVMVVAYGRNRKFE